MPDMKLPIAQGLALPIAPALTLALAPLAVHASDLTVDGLTSTTVPVGDSFQLSLTGNPGLPARIYADVSPGPSVFAGESVPLGLTSNLMLLVAGTTDGAGVLASPYFLPDDSSLAGLTIYLGGFVLVQKLPLEPHCGYVARVGQQWSMMKGPGGNTPGGIAIRPTVSRQAPPFAEALVSGDALDILHTVGRIVVWERWWWLAVSPGENGDVDRSTRSHDVPPRRI